MNAPRRPGAIAVLGGYGVFGQRLASELAARKRDVTIIGRRAPLAQAAAEQLGCRWSRADVTSPDDCRAIAAEHAVVAHCAGPFDAASLNVLEACLAQGAHYVDIAEDRAHTRALRERVARAERVETTVAFGCCSLPGLSLAAALVAAESMSRVDLARLTLMIGNHNPKGRGAVRAALGQMGRPIEGVGVAAFGRSERVVLPSPFGARRMFAFDSPDYDLIAQLKPRLPLTDDARVLVAVGFESRLVSGAIAVLGRLSSATGRSLGAPLAPLAACAPPGGCSGGAVMAELWDGPRRRAACAHGRHDGQRMAVLPALYVAEQLADGDARPGAWCAYDLIEPRHLFERIVRDGFEFTEM